EAREEIIAEIRVETFIIEVGIAIATALHSPERPRRNLRSRAIVIDPWVAGWLPDQGRCQLIFRDFGSGGTIRRDCRNTRQENKQKPFCHGPPPGRRPTTLLQQRAESKFLCE